MTTRAVVVAPAKVNLHLRVLHRRDDGFHEIDTILQAVDLADEVALELRDRGVTLDVDGADLGLPEENLAYRAASALLADAGVGVGVHVELTKLIPVGAGLGGGSSDAAAVLTGLAALLPDLDDGARLARVAATLGSDVPFFLGPGGRARARGTGERVEWLAPLPEAHLVIVSPPVHSATATAYQALERGRSSVSASEAAPVAESWTDVAASAHNDFEAVIAEAHPEVRRSLEALAGAGAFLAMLSGSGSSSFGLFEDAVVADRVSRDLQNELGWPCRAARTLARMPAAQVV